MGGLAAGVAGNMALNGLIQLGTGVRPQARDLLLTPGNIRRVADELAKMRGAAMKVGQLLSMEAGDYLPPDLTRILASLRENAHPMPLGQVAKVLERAWGEGWDGEFRQFSFTPLAAASSALTSESTGADRGTPV